MAAQLNNSTINTGQHKLFHESGKALKKNIILRIFALDF